MMFLLFDFLPVIPGGYQTGKLKCPLANFHQTRVPSTTLSEITEVGFDERNMMMPWHKNLKGKKQQTLSLTHVNTEEASQR